MEVQALVADCLTEALSQFDRALEECLVVPQLRLCTSVGSPALVVETVKEAVKESLRQRAINIWREDREVTRIRAEQARRRSRMLHTEIDKPVVAPAWNGTLPELRPERRMVLANKT